MTITPAPSGPLRTSFGQRRLWFADQIGEQGLEFVYPYALRLRGALDKAALARALEQVVDRHESLRTTYGLADGEPHQWIHATAPIKLEEHQLAGGLPDTTDGAQGVLPAAVQADLERPFDLADGPLLRMSLYEVGPEDHILLVVVHHIATDGWSMDVFFHDLTAFYDAERAGRPAELPELTLQYAGFAQWQRAQAESDEVDADLVHWRRQLADAPLVVDLPTDRPRPESQSYRGDCVTFHVPASDAAALTELARACHASPFMVLLAALHLTLVRWSGTSDLIIGTPLAHRPLPETERLIGFFVNLLAFRVRADERLTFRELLAHTRGVALDAYDHQTVTFDRIVEELAPARTLAHNPVIQITLTDETAAPIAFDGLATEVLDARLDITRYDLAFDYKPGADGGLRFDLYYATDLYDRKTVEQLAERFVRTIATSLAEPDRPACELPLTTASPDLAAPAPRTSPSRLVEGLREVAASDPDRTAVACKDRSLTFSALDREADRLAAALRRAGVGRTDVVGVCLPRGVELLVALVGVWRAGASFVPLDPDYPPARLAMMTADAGARTVITADASATAWDASVRLITPADLAADDGTTAPGPAAGNDPDDPAYVIFTSGSTGRPKGVQVPHRAVEALVDGLTAAGVYRPGHARVAWNASVSFDAAVQQWIRVFRGDTVVVLGEDERTDPEAFAAAIRRHAVTDLDLTPSHLQALLDVLPGAAPGRGPDTRLRLLVGGEPIRQDLWDTLSDWRERGVAEAVNVYGTTETTVDSTAGPVDGSEPHVGTPLPGVRAHLLDPWWREVPDGVDGELYLAGPQIADGYVGRPGLTAARFVPDVLAGDGSLMYRTGDLMRRVDGRLVFRGRADNQVKVRGYRIELGEVEAAIATAPGVDAVAACVTGDGKVLAAGYVSTTGAAPDRVAAHAAAHLPAHMIPSVLVRVDALPRTPSGKVDRDALADRLVPAGTAGAAAAGQDGADTLDGPIERLVASVWAEVLGLDAVGPHDNFFTLGGHSLMAIRLVARVKQTLALRLPIATIFEHATLRGLASHIDRLMRDELAKAQNR